MNWTQVSRQRTWVVGELLVVLDALLLAIFGVAFALSPTEPEDWRGVGYVMVVTSLPLFALALLAVPYARAAGWILIGIGAPLLSAVLALRLNMGDPAHLGDLVLFAIFVAPPLGGVLLLVAGHSARSRNKPSP